MNAFCAHVNYIADGPGYVKDDREIFDEVEEDDEERRRTVVEGAKVWFV